MANKASESKETSMKETSMKETSMNETSMTESSMVASRILIYCPHSDETRRYLQAFRAALPALAFVSIDELGHDGVAAEQAASVQHIICWGPPSGFFRPFTQLQTVFALGAGVDKLVQRDDLADNVSIVRLLDAGMAEQMIDYVLYGVLAVQRQFDFYARQQQQAQWRPFAGLAASELRCTVLGAGELGHRVALRLRERGHPVTVWSRQPKALADIASVAGWDALPGVFAHTDVLIALLPSTAETRGLLNAERLAWLPNGASLINAGRGDLIDEQALLAALDSGQLRRAQLDVFATEPLPPTHPFWRHPGIVLTPHVAAQTLLPQAVAQISANLKACLAGAPMSGLVDRKRQY